MMKIVILAVSAALLCLGAAIMTATNPHESLPLQNVAPIMIQVVDKNLKVNFTNLGNDYHVNPTDINEFLRGFGMRTLNGTEMQILFNKIHEIEDTSIIHNFNIVGQGYAGKHFEIACFPCINRYDNFTALTFDELLRLDSDETIYAVTKL